MRLTEAASGKTSKTAGSISTIFDPCAYLAAVTPRTAEEKSYSRRNVSRFSFPLLGFFFIELPFMIGRRPRGNQTRSGRPFGKGNNNKSLLIRGPKYNIPLFGKRVSWIWNCDRKRVLKCRCGFGEGHSVLSQI